MAVFALPVALRKGVQFATPRATHEATGYWGDRKGIKNSPRIFGHSFITLLSCELKEGSKGDGNEVTSIL